MARTRPSPPPLPPVPSIPTEFHRSPDYTAAATGPRDLAVRMGESTGAGDGTKVVTPDPFVSASA